MKLTGRLVPVAAVTAAQREAMWRLMDRHYADARCDSFEQDLAEKEWVIQVFDAAGELCGFSTQMLLEVSASGRPIRALFSGDTIIDRERWGDNALAHVWGRLGLRRIDASSPGALYWFLISKGYKTYRFLPVFFREFYPRYDVRTPGWAKEVIDALGSHKYPGAYDAAAGVIRAGPSQCRLRGEVAEVTAQRLRDPHVAFFRERNPGHARGDELCCIAPLSRANFTPAAYRVIGPEPVVVLEV